MKRALRYVILHMLKESFGRQVKPSATLCLFGVVLIGLASCGGGESSSPVSSSPTAQLGSETGAATKIVRVGGTAAAVVALFPDGRAYYSPNGFNLGGGGATTLAYDGALQVSDIVGVGGGVDALISNGSLYFSPDGQHLGGGGASLAAYKGPVSALSLTPVGSGVDTVFADGSVYFSPDGLNLGGGGNSVRVYEGASTVLQIVAVGPGEAVVTLFAGGTALYSPDNRNLGGGGSTVTAATAVVAKLVKVGGGVLAQFDSGAVYLSPDGLNLAGGGATISVPAWTAPLSNAAFPPRDSANGAEFLGRLWISGGYSYPSFSNSCYLTCSYFDLWSSTDLLGTAWNAGPSFATATAPNPRDQISVVNDGVQDAPAPTDFYDAYSPLVVWNAELTAIGSTVWRSADGLNWQRINLADGTAAPGPVPAPNHATENSKAVILGGSLYLLQTNTGEVYRSSDSDASVWTDLGVMPGYIPRCGAAAFALSGRIWVTGGGACDYSAVFNDVWSSADGVNWTQSATPAQWSGRMWPCVANDGAGVVWLAGGYAPTDWNNVGGSITRRYAANHADLWYTRNGTDWRQLKADAGSGLPDDGVFEPRHAPTCIVTGTASANSLTIIAGTGGPDPNAGNAETLNSIRVLPLPPTVSLP
jgi:hypothetical protein